MCQAHVWVVRGNEEEEVLRDVILVEQMPRGFACTPFSRNHARLPAQRFPL
jgi:hypothetical protein